MIRRRLLSIVSALALVLSLFTLLPEGALKAQAHSGGAIGFDLYNLILDPNCDDVSGLTFMNVTSITLPELKREEYRFLGWAETSEGTVKYKAGDNVTLDKDLTLYAKWIEANCYFSLSPDSCTLNGSGYTDIECTLTSLALGMINGEQTTGIGFYMKGGTLSDGNGHSIPFSVDNPRHGRAEGGKFQGDWLSSQGETFVMSIYIDPNDYNNAVPGTYTGTFTYDSYWYAGNKELPGESGSIALTLVVPEIEPSYTLEPTECTLNGSGYTDIECTLTSLVVGFINDKQVNKIGFYMNGGTLSDGNEHSIPFLVDNPRHGRAEGGKFQGDWLSSQGETFVMSIYIDPDDYNNAVPGTYTGTFTYDSFWYAGDKRLPGESGSIALKLVVPDLDAGSYTLEPTECTLNGSGYTDIECTLTSLVLGTAYNGEQTRSIGFYMNGGTLSDGSGHSIPFSVDNPFHFGAEGRKDQGNGHSSQGETFVMSIYIDPDDYNNAVPGIYTGTFTYDSFWRAGGKLPGESGSIALKLVVPEPAERLVGDINGDGDITADDAIIAARLAAGYGDYDSRYNSDVADMNRDGSVTADDAIIIARYAAGYGNYRDVYTKYI